MGPFLEGFDLYQALRGGSYPPYVRDFAVKVGTDSTGDPAAWVWVIIADHASNEVLGSRSAGIQEQMIARLHRAGIDLWPYISFRTVSEQEELEQALAS